MNTHLQRELEHLRERLLALGAEVERSMDRAHQALVAGDVETAGDVIEHDGQIDEQEVDIEEECLKLLALYQPVASDLRFVVAVLKINSDLERMADLAANIAQYVIEIAKRDSIEISDKFRVMFTAARKMVKGSLDALVQGDAVAAQQVCAQDDVVDELNRELIHDVREQMALYPGKMRTLLYLISVTRNIERIADYATNIAEDVYYYVHGTIIRHHHSPAEPGADV